jgi:hypothetical protein
MRVRSVIGMPGRPKIVSMSLSFEGIDDEMETIVVSLSGAAARDASAVGAAGRAARAEDMSVPF